MPEGGSAIQQYEIAVEDIGRMLRQAIADQTSREESYVESVSESVLAGPSMSTRDFGYLGEKLNFTRRQLTAARRFAGFYDLLTGVLDDAVANKKLAETYPSIWMHYKRTLEAARRFVRSGQIALKVTGSTVRGATPLMVQSDVYGHMAHLGSAKEARIAEEKRVGLAVAEQAPTKQEKLGVLKKLGISK